MNKIFVTIIGLWIVQCLCAQSDIRRSISGIVTDGITGESLTGATIYVKGSLNDCAKSGLDGSFSLTTAVGNPTLVCSFIGYKPVEMALGSEHEVRFLMYENSKSLSGVTVKSRRSGHTEVNARQIEQQSVNVVNVLSSKAIELSPDITVGNAIQRMSGVSVERNSSGEGQYAILRGMDKRYNYTLVNGMKIPSPDNKNRFVPLDLFPSEILDRIEVSKSLTADMEGDGIGGAVNLVMKDAPSRCLFSAGLSTGYNALFTERDFLSFNNRAINAKSPNEMKAGGDYGVTAADFSNDNLRVKSGRPLPDLLGSLAYGNRFFNDKLGFIAAISYQNIHRGKNSDWYYRSNYLTNGVERRTYSENRSRVGMHAKLDYILAQEHRISLYGGLLGMDNAQVRCAADDKSGDVRLKWNRQAIYNSTLSGTHNFIGGALQLNWTAGYSKATSKTPDNVQINLQGNHIATSNAAIRRWEHNSDRDISGRMDLKYSFVQGRDKYEIKAGGLFRDKKRDSFFNEYTFDSATGPEQPQTYGTVWHNFDEISIIPHRYGNIGDPLNYDASEKIGAGYVTASYRRDVVELTAGLRIEHTEQGYVLKYPREEDPAGRQTYTDILPDLHAKYRIGKKSDIHISYARAINRPSFFEIVPYSIINEEYKERGNPSLKHSVADNIDLRWEYFPGQSEQLMAGIFYKHIENPIEYGLITEGQDTYYMPMNLGNASNMGIEIDILKYFNRFGIKGNYTYTYSRITTDKRIMDGNAIKTVRQTRPLFGQAAHVANLSLLYKDTGRGWDAQLTTSLIGKRLSDISNWYDNDIWENSYFRMELSAEKSFQCGLSLFAKATNLLNLPLVRYIQKGPHTDGLKGVERTGGNVVERKERYGQTIMAGLRYKL